MCTAVSPPRSRRGSRSYRTSRRTGHPRMARGQSGAAQATWATSKRCSSRTLRFRSTLKNCTTMGMSPRRMPPARWWCAPRGQRPGGERASVAVRCETPVGSLLHCAHVCGLPLVNRCRLVVGLSRERETMLPCLSESTDARASVDSARLLRRRRHRQKRRSQPLSRRAQEPLRCV